MSSGTAMQQPPPPTPAGGIPTLPSIPSLDNTYGALLLGSFVSLMLYGLTIHQTYRYWRTYKADTIYLRCYVCAIVLFDTFHTGLCMHMSYWYLVVNYFHPDRLFTGVWSLNILPITLGVIIISCQCFFARRVYLIGPKFRFVSIIAVIMFAGEMGFAIASTLKAFVLPNLQEFHKYAWLISAAFGLAVTSNAMLTTALIVVLHKSRTTFKQTNSKIDVLIRYAICTGLATDLCAFSALILAIVQPNNLIYTGIDLATSKLYVNSVLAALNFRESLNSPGASSRGIDEIKLSALQRSGGAGGSSWGRTTEASVIDIKAVDFLVDSGTHSQTTAVGPSGRDMV